MARETRVGLLAGLAFIICFAVILANRGREGMIERYLPGVVSGYRDAAGTAQQPTSDSLRQRSPDAGSDPGSDATPAAARRVENLARNGRVDSPPMEQPSNRRDNTADDAQGRDAGSPRELTERAADQGAYARADEYESRQRALERRLDELAAIMHAEGRKEPTALVAEPIGSKLAPRSLSSSTPDAEVTRYRVASGDTLSKIAQMHYGTKSRRAIDGIFDANRGSLADPNALHVGVELVLPIIQGISAPSRVDVNRTREVPVPSRKPSEADESRRPRHRYYQIRKNDRYISIARDQLGDEGRWQEIYELNKDKFPDARKIREGVRIKLPGTRVADSRRGRS